MLLNDKQIQTRGLVEEARPEKFRNTGYDLTVGTIIDPDGKTHEDGISISGSGIIEIVSAETLNLPANVTGFAHVKTSLVDNGLLPLNIGIIDPGWHAKISATLLNFGERDRLIQKGDAFLRVTFIEHTEGTKGGPAPITAEEYIKDKRRKITENFGETFLGLDGFKEELTAGTQTKIDEAEKRVLPGRLAALISILALILALFQLVGAYFIAADPFHWMGRTFDDFASKKDVTLVKTTAGQALDRANAQQVEIEQLRDQVRALALPVPKTMPKSPKK